MEFLDFLGHLLGFIGGVTVIQNYIRPVENIIAVFKKSENFKGGLFNIPTYKYNLKDKYIISLSGLCVILGSFFSLVASFMKLLD